MFNLEEAKRKINTNNTLKHGFGSSSHNNIIATLDKKRNDLSKEKYVALYQGTETIISPKIMIIPILKEVQSLTLDKLNPTNPTKILIRSIKSSFNPNLSRRTRWRLTPRQANNYIWTCKTYSLIKKSIWTK